MKSSDRQAIINQPECGRRINEIRGERIKKIAGGQQANPEDWGWQAILYLRGRFICGGSLINNEWVITAAHCISSNNAPSDYSIRLGLHNRFNPENYSILRNLSDIIIHPNNQFDYRKFDIALIKLFVSNSLFLSKNMSNIKIKMSFINFLSCLFNLLTKFYRFVFRVKTMILKIKWHGQPVGEA